MNVLDQLRAATRADHGRLEQRLDILSRLAAPSDRCQLLGRFLGIYEPFEAALAPRLARLPDLHFEQRRKCQWLLQDLAALGRDARQIADLPRAALPAADSLGQALGIAYVLEGATLGAHVIRKQADRLGLGRAGFRFYESYGEETGAMWRSFCAGLERHCGAPQTSRQATEGARFAFRSIENWLLDQEDERNTVYVDVAR